MTRHTWFAVLLAPLLCGAAVAAPPITAAAFSTDGKQVVLGSQGGIEIRSWPELKTASRLKTELSHVHDLAFSPDGKTLLAAGGSPAKSGAVEVLSWPDGKLIRRVAEHRDVVYRVAWSPDGSCWATAGADSSCRVYASETGKLIAKFDGHSAPSWRSFSSATARRSFRSGSTRRCNSGKPPAASTSELSITTPPQ